MGWQQATESMRRSKAQKKGGGERKGVARQSLVEEKSHAVSCLGLLRLRLPPLPGAASGRRACVCGILPRTVRGRRQVKRQALHQGGGEDLGRTPGAQSRQSQRRTGCNADGGRSPQRLLVYSEDLGVDLRQSLAVAQRDPCHHCCGLPAHGVVGDALPRPPQRPAARAQRRRQAEQQRRWQALVQQWLRAPRCQRHGVKDVEEEPQLRRRGVGETGRDPAGHVLRQEGQQRHALLPPACRHHRAMPARQLLTTAEDFDYPCQKRDLLLCQEGGGRCKDHAYAIHRSSWFQHLDGPHARARQHTTTTEPHCRALHSQPLDTEAELQRRLPKLPGVLQRQGHYTAACELPPAQAGLQGAVLHQAGGPRR
mmetsp:Transcript_117790/g.345056  ORF Transcript_117790/g.345056 Transcript_117790/m.345056 type:complete len:368 (+) Transcript_117790:139-1242(+)